MTAPNAIGTFKHEDAEDFLRHHAPFDRLSPDDLRFLIDRLTRIGLPAATVVAAPDLGVPDACHIVVRGEVMVTEGESAAGTQEVMLLEAGECFPIGALTGRRPPVYTFAARGAIECYRLVSADFHELLARSTVFGQFCNGYLSSLLNQSHAQMQVRMAQQATEEQSLNMDLGQLAKRAPFAVPATTPLREAFERMAEMRVGSVVVIDAGGVPTGIFTQSDLLDRVVLPGISLDQPVESVMSPAPFTLSESARACEAVLAMAMRGIRHVLVVNHVGVLTGVVSERDLFALQRVGLRQIRQEVATATDRDTLKKAAADVHQFAFNMLAQGVGAEQLTQFISALNDAITCRLIELNLQRHDLPTSEWAWLAFGSEGREEQTLSTDQDNGIVFDCPAGADREALRQTLLAFASEVNADLDACGFPLCKGNIMASNPEWCLTLDEWRQKFSSWIDTPEPTALLNATIFFDFRTLYGPARMADLMYQHLFRLSRANSAFQRMLAANALQVEPPLGIIRDFVTESEAGGPAFIDLKKFGSRLFVDAARVFALAHGIHAASTARRLRLAAQLPRGIGSEGEALIDAFNFIQLLRLRHQHMESSRGRPGDNRVVPGELNQLDRRILKETFRQARQLQQKLKLNYQL